MTKYTALKGSHPFRIGGIIPPIPVVRRGIERVEWRVKFAPNCAYTLPREEWKDWNKGGGAAFDLLDNHIDSAMWGWRYNPKSGIVELTAYCHLDGKRPILRESPYSKTRPGVSGEVCLEVEFEVEAVITLVINWTEKRYDLFFSLAGGQTYRVGVPFTHNKTMVRLINGWFGGKDDETQKQTPAPHRMDIYVKRKF